jgi:hypothetical protein
MKLSQKTEWIVVGVLIVYIAFVQPIPAIRDALATPIGKAVALVGVVYVWKYVSAIVALLLVVAIVRCMSMPRVWEMFSGAETTCLCEGDGYSWDPATKKCKDKDGKEGTVKSCVCASGYAWDGGEKGTRQCVPVSGEQPPVPVPAVNPVVSMAPAESTAPVTSSAPMTTPGAAADMASGATPMVPETTGVQPGATTTTSTPATL